MVKTPSGHHLYLYSLIFIGLLLRLFFAFGFKPTLTPHQALLGLRTQSLISTGVDETGRRFPLFFTSSESYQLPVSTYILVPLIKFFGLSEFTIKLPFIIFDTISLFAIYYLCKAFFPKHPKSWLGAVLLMSVSPWTIFLSSQSSIVNLSLCYFLIGMIFSTNPRTPLTYLSIVFSTLAMYTHQLAWIIIPAYYLIRSTAKGQRSNFILLCATLLLSLPLILSYLKLPQFQTDFKNQNLSFFSDISIINGVNTMRGEDARVGLSTLGKLFYNKSAYGLRLLENFTKHLNPRIYFAVDRWLRFRTYY